MPEGTKTSSVVVAIICLIVTASFFVLDLILPLGVAGGVPYIAVVLLATRSPWSRLIPLTAVGCTVLTIFGYFLSQEGGEHWKVLANRTLAVFAIWVAASLGYVWRRSESHLRILTEELADRVAERTQALQEKEVLLKEIHHRVKNNLQVVSSLLSLQSARADSTAVEDVFFESQQRIQAMALIHEQLYQTSDLSAIDMREYVQRLSEAILASHQNSAAHVQVELDVESFVVDIDTGVTLGLLLNEVCANAYEHAFSADRPGTVSIHLSVTNDGGRRLVVSDDGPGLPADFDLEKPGSMGTQLIKALTAQLGGTLGIDGEDGVRVQVDF
jgi:two-component sensor histidine kinase